MKFYNDINAEQAIRNNSEWLGKFSYTLQINKLTKEQRKELERSCWPNFVLPMDEQFGVCSDLEVTPNQDGFIDPQDAINELDRRILFKTNQNRRPWWKFWV